MIIQGEKLKNAGRKEGLAALCELGPRVKCHFDNGQEFFAKKSGEAIFSWRTKGDFTLPIIPFAVGAIVAGIALSCAFSSQKTK